MKNNTTDAKRLIEQAIRLLPNDNALSETRFHLRAALGHVEAVEEKRARRETTQRQNEMNERLKQMGTLPVTGTIDLRENLRVIDELIAAENKKLEEIKSRRQRGSTPNEIPLEDDLIRD